MLLLPAPSIDASRDRTDSRSLAAPTGRTAQTQAMPPSQPTASRTRAARIWTQVSKLNTRHMQFAWITLGTLALTDFYIMLVASGSITDLRFIG